MRGARRAGREDTIPPVRRFLRNNGLSITMFVLFAVFLGGQALAGRRVYNDEQREHREQTVELAEYLTSGHFIEAVFENWESEFLQMGSYVLLTVFLFQKGSPESRKIGQEEPQDADPRRAKKTKPVPWPVRRGGIALKLYENSLALAFLVLFLLSIALHAIGGADEYSQQQVEHGGKPISVGRFMTTWEFWYQSFQNWQSEFLAVGTLVVLSIFLRQRGSPESKPVAYPHHETGT